MIYKWQQRLSFDISECVGSKNAAHIDYQVVCQLTVVINGRQAYTERTTTNQKHVIITPITQTTQTTTTMITETQTVAATI